MQIITVEQGGRVKITSESKEREYNEYLLRKCTCKKCGGHVEIFNYIQKGTFVEHKEGDCKKTTRVQG